MNIAKRGRPSKLTDEQYHRIVEWKRLSELCRDLGVPKKTAERIRTKHRQVFQ